MPTLGVNIDHVATLREVRRGIEPEPVFAALIAQSAGADSIVAHLREDRRHIKEKDLYMLKRVIGGKLNLEMSCEKDIVDIACKVKPAQATLVPERRRELTTEGGLDAAAHFKRVAGAVKRLQRRVVAVSLFVDPQKKQIDAAQRTGAGIIELHTGAYAEAQRPGQRVQRLKELELAARYAHGKGLRVCAGHGLDYCNVTAVARLQYVEELNIGYSIICRAVLVGLYQAVKEMKTLLAHR
jgi:pyridoxine 5-phosphate synthase